MLSITGNIERAGPSQKFQSQIKVDGPGSLADGGPISIDLRSLAAKKGFRWKSRTHVIDRSVLPYR